MVSKVIVALCVLALTGCATRIKIVEVPKPILTCPAPPLVDRPELFADKLTDEDLKNPGKIVQSWKADRLTLMRYFEMQQKILSKYKEVSVDFSNIQNDLEKMYEQSKTAIEETNK